MHHFNIWNENQLMSLFYSYIAGSLHVSGPEAYLMEWKPTDVTILFVYCRISTCFGPTGPSSGEFTQLFTQPLVPGLSFWYRASFQHMKWKTNWCHYFIRILLDLYMFRAHRPIFRRVHTTIGSWVVLCEQPRNQWLCEQLCELSWRWAGGPETCRDPSIYE